MPVKFSKTGIQQEFRELPLEVGYEKEGCVIFRFDTDKDNIYCFQKIYNELERLRPDGFSSKQMLLDFIWSCVYNDEHSKFYQISLQSFEDLDVKEHDEDMVLDLTGPIRPHIHATPSHEGSQFEFKPAITWIDLMCMIVNQSSLANLSSLLQPKSISKLIAMSGCAPDLLPVYCKRWSDAHPPDSVSVIVRVAYLLTMLGSTPGFYDGSNNTNAQVMFSIMKQAIIIDCLGQMCQGNLGRDRDIILRLVCCTALMFLDLAGDYATILTLVSYAVLINLEEEKYDEYPVLSMLDGSTNSGFLISNVKAPAHDWLLYANEAHEGVIMPNGDVIFLTNGLKPKLTDFDLKLLDSDNETIAVLSVSDLKGRLKELVQRSAKIIFGGITAASLLLLIDGFFIGWLTRAPNSQVTAIVGFILFFLMFCDDLTQRFLSYTMNKYFVLVIVTALAVAQNTALSNHGVLNDSTQADTKKLIFPIASLIVLIGAVAWWVKAGSFFSIDRSLFKSNKTGITFFTLRNIINRKTNSLSETECAALLEGLAGRADSDKNSAECNKFSQKYWWYKVTIILNSIEDEDIDQFVKKYLHNEWQIANILGDFVVPVGH